MHVFGYCGRIMAISLGTLPSALGLSGCSGQDLLNGLTPSSASDQIRDLEYAPGQAQALDITGRRPWCPGGGLGTPANCGVRRRSLSALRHGSLRRGPTSPRCWHSMCSSGRLQQCVAEPARRAEFSRVSICAVTMSRGQSRGSKGLLPSPLQKINVVYNRGVLR